MSIRITKRPDMAQLFEKKKKAIAEAMARTAEEQATEISRRTQAGTDADGGSFAPYSAGYLAKRRKAGRGSKPDLNFKGTMLRSIRSQVRALGSKIQARIYFNGAKEALKAKGNLRKRKFFALAKSQVEAFKKAIKEAGKS